MRRLFVSLAFLLAAWISIGASTIHSIRIDVSLEPDGDARVTEVWDVTQTEGTEWYLQKSGLDGITIRDFGVTDETGTVYVLQFQFGGIQAVHLGNLCLIIVFEPFKTSHIRALCVIVDCWF